MRLVWYFGYKFNADLPSIKFIYNPFFLQMQTKIFTHYER